KGGGSTTCWRRGVCGRSRASSRPTWARAITRPSWPSSTTPERGTRSDDERRRTFRPRRLSVEVLDLPEAVLAHELNGARAVRHGGAIARLFDLAAWEGLLESRDH